MEHVEIVSIAALVPLGKPYLSLVWGVVTVWGVCE